MEKKKIMAIPLTCKIEHVQQENLNLLYDPKHILLKIEKYVSNSKIEEAIFMSFYTCIDLARNGNSGFENVILK